MQMFDPLRPRQPSGRLTYLWLGREVAAIPAVDVDPEEDGSFRVSAMLKVSANSFSWHFHTVADASALAQFFVDFRNDPEAVMRELWHYTGPSGRGDTVVRRTDKTAAVSGREVKQLLSL